MIYDFLVLILLSRHTDHKRIWSFFEKRTNLKWERLLDHVFLDCDDSCHLFSLRLYQNSSEASLLRPNKAKETMRNSARRFSTDFVIKTKRTRSLRTISWSDELCWRFLPADKLAFLTWSAAFNCSWKSWRRNSLKRREIFEPRKIKLEIFLRTKFESEEKNRIFDEENFVRTAKIYLVNFLFRVGRNSIRRVQRSFEFADFVSIRLKKRKIFSFRSAEKRGDIFTWFSASNFLRS